MQTRAQEPYQEYSGVDNRMWLNELPQCDRIVSPDHFSHFWHSRRDLPNSRKPCRKPLRELDELVEGRTGRRSLGQNGSVAEFRLGDCEPSVWLDGELIIHQGEITVWPTSLCFCDMNPNVTSVRYGVSLISNRHLNGDLSCAMCFLSIKSPHT